MNPWAKRRKIFILVVGVLSVSIFLVVSWLLFFHESATCDDLVKNGDERGVDCGGSCLLLCAADVNNELLIVHFARPLQTGPGIWGAVALVENRNSGGMARFTPYIFRLYDAKNILVAERRGETDIPSHKTFAVFEGAMITGDRIPTRAIFEFTAPPRFMRVGPEPALVFKNKQFTVASGRTLLETTVINPTRVSLAHLTVAALLFDGEGNVFAASRTELFSLQAGKDAPLAFTWSRTLPSPARIELLYMSRQDE